MKKTLFLIAVLVLSIVIAKKPSSPDHNVVEWSNGFPSGPHFNLNIHGKKAGYVCDETPGGGSVFVPEYGDSLIQYIMNKKSGITELTVLDPCSFSTNDPAKVQLPTGEYQVYARILAKPHHKKDPGTNRSVIFYPMLLDACNDNETGIPGFENYTDCTNESLVGLGVATGSGAFSTEGEEFVRGRGKSKAVEITDMFTWSGFACDESVDINNDSLITVADVPIEYDYLVNGGNNNTVIDTFELDNYLADLVILGTCEEFTDEWIFNIADLVVYGWDYQNKGSKLLQVRFYPIAETEFV